MTDIRTEAIKMALEFIVLASSKDRAWFTEKEFEVLAALRQALSQPEQEPDYGAVVKTQLEAAKTELNRTLEDATVDAIHKLYNTLPKQSEQNGNEKVCELLRMAHDILSLSSAPPKREWKGLTSDDKHFLLANAWNKEQAFDGFMDAIDKFLEEKNT